MPKKKGKSKQSSGKKRKGKGAKKAAKDAEIKSMSQANSKLWETKLELTEKSRQEYRECATKLLLENNLLDHQMKQSEKDTIDIVTYLKKQDEEKEKQIEKILHQMKELKKEHGREKDKIIDEFSLKLNDVGKQLEQKTNEVDVLQAELKAVREFRHKRSQMQQELDQIREALLESSKEHKGTLVRLEQKFIDEKMKLQQEANQKVAELADEAHHEAIANLDETTRAVYKENVRLNEALAYHLEDNVHLKKHIELLQAENDSLTNEKEVNNCAVKEKISNNKQLNRQITELKEKLETAEAALSHLVQDFDRERKLLLERLHSENEVSFIEIAKLRRTLELKTKELSRIKKLAKNILDQRTEVEQFFLDALEKVKTEVITNRLQYRKDAQAAFQQKMLDAYVGNTQYPKVRTFHKSDYSTNNVFQDLKAAENMNALSGQVNISDLTWEQKERVLRYLFGRMNGAAVSTQQPSFSSPCPHVLPSIQQISSTELDDTTNDYAFLTQAYANDTNKEIAINQLSVGDQVDTS